MIVAVASGKGGTGKTTVAVNLARVIQCEVQLLDCDVEQPNAHLFIQGAVSGASEVGIPVPQVDASLCNACGECSAFCEYHAIVSFGAAPLVFPELCHGCGGCSKVCPTGAIRETPQRIGVVEGMQAGAIQLVQGRLDVGAAMAPPLIRAVKKRMRQGVTILDAPPGTSCPVVAAIQETDFVVLVTEPTPFGLHDLILAVDMTRQLGLACGVVVNRVGVGDERVHVFCAQERIPILLEIPDDRRIAESYSHGRLLTDALPEYRVLFEGLWDRLAGMPELSGRREHGGQ